MLTASANERVYDPKTRETSEIAVGRPDFANAMLQANCCYPGVMNTQATSLASGCDRSKFGPVAVRLRQQCEVRSLHPRVDLAEGGLKWRGRIEKPSTCDDSQKFVHARPRDRPWSVARGKRYHAAKRAFVVRPFLAVSVDENIRVDGDQSSLSYAHLWISSQPRWPTEG